MKQVQINKNYTFLMIPTKVLKNQEICDNEKLILSTFISYFNKYSNIQISIERIAEELGSSLTTVKRNISKLVEKGLVKRIPVFENNIKKSNRYEINYSNFNKFFDFDYFVETSTITESKQQQQFTSKQQSVPKQQPVPKKLNPKDYATSEEYCEAYLKSIGLMKDN